MSYTCSRCDAQFQSAAGVTRHLALHHDTCAECDEEFETTARCAATSTSLTERPFVDPSASLPRDSF
jgi:DNA-directed RNA polymerase subunit RPC12/RpoP